MAASPKCDWGCEDRLVICNQLNCHTADAGMSLASGRGPYQHGSRRPDRAALRGPFLFQALA